VVEFDLQFALEAHTGDLLDCFAVAGCDGGIEASMEVAGYVVAITEEEGARGSLASYGVFFGEPPG